MTGTTNGSAPHDADAGRPADRNAAVLHAIRGHHAALGRDLADRVDGVLAAVAQAAPDRPGHREETGAADPVQAARTALLAFLHDELLPHAAAEERTLYAAAASDRSTESLVRAMIDEHGALVELVGRLETVADPVALAATAGAVRTLFAVHVHKENEYLLPALDRSGTDLEALLSGMHRLLTGPLQPQ